MLSKNKFRAGLECPVSPADKDNSPIYLVEATRPEEIKICPDDPPDTAAQHEAQSFEAPARCSAVSGAHEPFEPRAFGPYQLIWKICQDALSTTYAAKRQDVEILAVRIFNERVTGDAEVKRVIKAAKSASELTHFNILTVYECGISNSGAPYVVTSWVESENLAQEIALQKRLDIARLLHIINQVCEALIEAHSRQLLHNNLSPEKILLVNEDSDSDLVKVIDFGMPPDPVKNAFYLSPEQCLDRNKVNARSDIYSLGCVMYEALTGNPPFTGYSLSQASLNHLHELANQFSPESPEHKALKLLDCIIVKCLQKKPAKRFGSIVELKDALRLVDACIRGGSTKKLPPRAERLLLFRFLDLFDRKIVVALFTYLLLGMTAMKFNAEMQLQKYIDEAQLAVFSGDLPRAQQDWRLAIQQAKGAGKPPSLLADLHWELADCLQSSRYETMASDNKTDGLVKEAIAQYEEAFKYFGVGTHFRSHSIQLLHVIGDLWYSLEGQAFQESRLESVRQKAGTLYRQKKYSQCALLCTEYLQNNNFDNEIARLAGCAFNSIATSLPPQKGLRIFERSAYYLGQAELTNPGSENPSENLLICKSKLQAKSHRSLSAGDLAAKALAEGDIEAALGEIGSDNQGFRAGLAAAISNYQRARSIAYAFPAHGPNIKPTINAWERALKLEETAYGQNNPRLSETLFDLAKAYREDGQDFKSMQAYSRYFELNKERNNISRLLPYLDLLDKHKQYDKVRRLLLQAMRQSDGSIHSNHELYVRLIKAYADCAMKAKAQESVSVFQFKAAVEPPYRQAYAPGMPPGFLPAPLALSSTVRDEFEQ